MRPSLHTFASVLPLALLFACSGDDGGPTGKDTDTEDTDVQPSFLYKGETVARAYDAALTPDTIQAHQMSNMFLAGVAVVVADEKTMDRLITDGGAKGVAEPPTGEFECWERPAFPMWSFDINYETCNAQGYEMGGGVAVEDHPSGPLLFSFNTFNIEGRTLGGTFGLDTRLGTSESLYWGTFNTDRTNPSLDNDVPMGVGVDGITSALEWLGGSHIDFDAGTWSMWGELTLKPENRDFTIVHGGVTPDDVSADTASADAVVNSLNWQECRCPTSGTSSYELVLAFEKLTLDLDDLEVNDDGIDDPSFDIEIDHVINGSAVIEYTGCGEQDITYDVGGTSVDVPGDVVVAATSFLCDTRAIADEERCLAIVQGLRAVGDFRVDIPEDDVRATAQTAVDEGFDGPWCLTY